jgi:hypothetical protein
VSGPFCLNQKLQKKLLMDLAPSNTQNEAEIDSTDVKSLTTSKKVNLQPLKNKGIQGLICGGVVLGALLIIILLSKLNEARKHKLPMLWRGRLKKLVDKSAKNVRIAEESNDAGMALHHAIQAQSILETAQDMIGAGNLAKITGMDIEILDQKIQSVIHTLSEPLNNRQMVVNKE